MLRAAGLILSILIHVLAVILADQAAVQLHHRPAVYQVDLVSPGASQPAPAPEPEPQPPVPEPEPKPEPGPPQPEPAPAEPAPRPEPRIAKPQAPPTEPLPPEPVLVPEAEPGTTLISPTKRPDVQVVPAENATAQPGRVPPPRQYPSVKRNEELWEKPVIHVGSSADPEDMLPHKGESRLALRQLAVRDFGAKDYIGHYVVEPGRYVSIIDGRELYDRLVLYDSKTGAYRVLFQYGHMVYVYGPSFATDRPIEGSVTFLPYDDTASKPEYQDSAKPDRLMWQPPDPPMFIAVKTPAGAKPVRFKNGRTVLTGTLFTPPAENGPVPGVVWVGDPSCAPTGPAREFAATMRQNGVAVLILDRPGCTGASGRAKRTDPEDMAEDALAAVNYLGKVKGVDPGAVGVWAADSGAEAALMAASEDRVSFAVITMTSAVGVPDLNVPGGASTPVLWIFPATEPGVSDDRVRVMEGTQRLRGRDYTLRILPLDGLDLDNENDKWLARLSPGSADLACPWILQR